MKRRYRYLITYEVEIVKAPGIAVRNLDFYTDERIKTRIAMETAETLISLKKEEKKPVKIVGMQLLTVLAEKEHGNKGKR